MRVKFISLSSFLNANSVYHLVSTTNTLLNDTVVTVSCFRDLFFYSYNVIYDALDLK